MNTTTITNKTLNQSRRRNRRPRGGMNRTVTNTTRIIQARPPGQGQSRKSRRRRNLRSNRSILPLTMTRRNARSNYFNAYFSHPDPGLELSVHRQLQTLFYPTKGLHRGLARGLEMSALAYSQGSIDVSTSAANNYICFQFQPTLVSSAATGSGLGKFGCWGSTTSITDPETLAAPGIINGPIPFTVATTSRTVSFTLNIIPASTTLNRGGEGKLAYCNSAPNVAWTRSALDNLPISKAWDGMTAMSMHWVPSVAENNFAQWDNVNGYVKYTDDISAILGYIMVPLGTVSSWRIEYVLGVEYIPTDAYRPYVEKKPPTLDPSAPYHVNQVIQQHWSPLMISTYAGYQNRLDLATSLGGATDLQYHDSAGMGGVGFTNPTIVEAAQALEEEEDGTIMSFIKGMGNTACNFVEGATGQPFCDDPSRSLGNLARDALGRSRGSRGNLSLLQETLTRR